MAKGVRYTEEFRELPLQALEQFRGGARVADDGREPEDGQRFPSCVVEDRRRRRPSDRGTRQGVDAVAVRRPARDRRGRDQLQEGPQVHDRGRRPRPGARHLDASGSRTEGVRRACQIVCVWDLFEASAVFVG